jgi:carboxylesterase type B
VYAPTTPVNGTKLPVFVYIQGGGYNLNANPNYNGTGLIMASDMNIVVVTFNYRVGPYGFLAGEEIQKGGSLNNGIKDMIKALEWVHQYIDKVRPSIPPSSQQCEHRRVELTRVI